MKRDVSTFNPRKIPMTEAKQDLIEASRSPLEVWICDHYDALVKGISCADALVSKPSDLKDKAFQLQIKGVCDRKQRRVEGKREWFYIMKEEAKPLYHQTVYSEDEEVDE